MSRAAAAARPATCLPTLHTYPHRPFLMPLVLVACVVLWWVHMLCSLCGCWLSRMPDSLFAFSLFALSYLLLALRSLLCPLVLLGHLWCCFVVSCHLPPVVLQAYLDTTELLSRTRARLLCQDAASCKSSSLVLSSLVSRLVSLVLFVCCLTSLVLSCLVAYLPYMPYRALKAFRRC
jgi:hypothetical protein